MNGKIQAFYIILPNQTKICMSAVRAVPTGSQPTSLHYSQDTTQFVKWIFTVKWRKSSRRTKDPEKEDQGCPNVWKKSKCLVTHTDKSLNVWAYIGTFKQILGGFCLERGYFVWRWGVLSPLPSYHSYEPIIWYKILWNSVKIGKMGLFSGPFPLELVY